MVTTTIYVGDCLKSLQAMPSNSVQCCVTSPPYWGLRDYGHDEQIGMERSPEEYVARMVAVFREVRRVLRDDGTLWLNLGDSYAANGKGGGGGASSSTLGSSDGKPGRGIKQWEKTIRAPKIVPAELKPKDLVGIPWRVAFALQADGWWLRQDIIWHKPNPMPESVTDRCTKAHEYLFLLTKSERYYYDHDSIKEPSIHAGAIVRNNQGENGQMGKFGNTRTGFLKEDGVEVPATRNRRSVWTIPIQQFKGAHFAVMPEALVEPCILAGSSQHGCCSTCGKPWERVVETFKDQEAEASFRHGRKSKMHGTRIEGGFNALNGREWNRLNRSTTTGWRAACACDVSPVSCTVLDPFGGAGTTALVAQRHKRNTILCELNPSYVQIAVERIQQQDALYTTIDIVNAESRTA